MEIFDTGEVQIAYERWGQGDPVVLLHGFPQTHALWSDVAPRLEGEFEVVAPDLRGYGASSAPEPAADLSNYSFRAMAEDVHGLMLSLGHRRYHLVGHDRGARVAYRLSRDKPKVVASLTLMDIVPTDHLVETCDFAMAKTYFHWTFLAQLAPLPERLIEADPDLFFEACLGSWGRASLKDFRYLSAYRHAWRKPEIIAGMTNDYRAAVSIDLEHDAADPGIVRAPALVLYGADGVVGKKYNVEAIWQERLPDMTVRAMPGGHFFVDQHGDMVADALLSFLRAHRP